MNTQKIAYLKTALSNLRTAEEAIRNAYIAEQNSPHRSNVEITELKETREAVRKTIQSVENKLRNA